MICQPQAIRQSSRYSQLRRILTTTELLRQFRFGVDMEYINREVSDRTGEQWCSRTFSITLADTYRDKVNASTWNGFPAKTVKVGSISANRKEIIRNNAKSYYWEVSYQFEFNRDTWKRKILNEGFRRKFVSGGVTKKEHIKDDGGQYVATPYLLGNTGDKLAIDGTPVWLEFDVYKTADFSAFNITL